MNGTLRIFQGGAKMNGAEKGSSHQCISKVKNHYQREKRRNQWGRV
jgi:hypothetical protein